MNYFDLNAFSSYTQGTPLSNQQHLDYLKSRSLEYISEREYDYGDSDIKNYPNGIDIPVEKIINIFRSNSPELDGKNLYELLSQGHTFRHRSLHEFFDEMRKTSIQGTKNWLGSNQCAITDSSGELPSAKYFEDIDKYLILTGQNRAFAALLIEANVYKVSQVIYCRPKEEPTPEVILPPEKDTTSLLKRIWRKITGN